MKGHYMSHRKLPPFKNRAEGGFLGPSETRKYRTGMLIHPLMLAQGT